MSDSPARWGIPPSTFITFITFGYGLSLREILMNIE